VRQILIYFCIFLFNLTIISCSDKEEYTTTYRSTFTTYIKQVIPTIHFSSSAAMPGGQKFGPIEDGSFHTLSWTSTNVSSCSASGDWTGDKSVSGTESITEITSASKTYTLTCTGEYGSTSESVFLKINLISDSTIHPYWQTIIPDWYSSSPTDYQNFSVDTQVNGQLEGLQHEPTDGTGAGKFIFNRVYRSFKHGLEWGQQFGVFGSWLGSYGVNSIEGGLSVNPKTAGPEYYPTLHLAGIGDMYHGCNDVTMGGGLYERILGDKWLTLVQVSNKILSFPGSNIIFDKDQNPYEADNGIWIGQGWTYLNLDHPRGYKYWISFIESKDYQGPVNGYIPEHFNWIDPDKINDGTFDAIKSNYDSNHGGFGTFATKGSNKNSINGNERIGLKALNMGNDTYFVPLAHLPIYKSREYLIQHPNNISQTTMENYSTALKNSSLSSTLIGSTVKSFTSVYKSTHNQLKLTENIKCLFCTTNEHRFFIVPSYQIGFEDSLGYVDWDFSTPAKKLYAQQQNGYIYVKKLSEKWVVEEEASDDYKYHPNQYKTEIIDPPDSTVRVPNVTHQFFSYKERDTSHTDFGNWNISGKTKYTVTLQNGSVATYVWFKFIEQPAVLTAKQNHPETYTDAYLQTLQTYIEKLHTLINNNSVTNPTNPVFINYRGATNPDNKDPHLAQLDPVHLVQPSVGNEVGYVPIVISVYHAQEYSKNGTGLVTQPADDCTNAKWSDTYYPDF